MAIALTLLTLLTLVALDFPVPNLPSATFRQYLQVIRFGYPGGAHHPAWPSMILTPFGARLLWSSGGFPIRFSTYVLIRVIAFSCLLQINRKVIQLGLLRADTPSSFYARDTLPTVITIALFLASIPVSFVTGWAYVLWGATPGVERVIHLFQARRRAAGARDQAYPP